MYAYVFVHANLYIYIQHMKVYKYVLCCMCLVWHRYVPNLIRARIPALVISGKDFLVEGS